MAGEVIILDEGGGGALDAVDLKGLGDETSETEGGVFGTVFLVVGGFVAFVDDDKAEVFEGGKESGARADDDLGFILRGEKELCPGLMAG